MALSADYDPREYEENMDLYKQMSCLVALCGIRAVFAALQHVCQTLAGEPWADLFVGLTDLERKVLPPVDMDQDRIRDGG
jgi:hypothetical protein